MRDRFEVKIEKPAVEMLLEMDERDAALLSQGIRQLEVEPFPVSQKERETTSMAFAILVKRGYQIRRLKVQDVLGWRVFYYVDTRNQKVLVKEVIARTDDTYAPAAPHVRRLVENYRRYFCREVEH
ncbi:MAG TPA: hypothetical protein PKL08_00930 [Thermoanaerobaculaceae bacterium]|nr:hypothetical protein [Thermoanaerobaculaceae bacterium]